MTMIRPRKRHVFGSLAALSCTVLALGTAACSSSSGAAAVDSGHPTPARDASPQTTPDGGDATSTAHDATTISLGGDSSTAHDATPDVSMTTPDVTTTTDARGDTSAVTDGSGGDGELDDAKTADGSHDGAVKSEAGSEDAAKDSSIKDSGKDAVACTLVTVPTGTGGAPACTMPEAGTCGPGSLTGFVPTSPPPTGASQGLCTSTQIQNIYNDCLTSTGTCPEENAGDPGQACYNCIFTNETDPKWGPLVANAANIVSVNVGGCLQILEPCNSACAAAFENDFECEDYACATNCAKATVTQFEACSTSVDNCDPGGCAAYSVAEECRAQITGAAHPGAACFPASNGFETAFLAVAPIFCGN